MERVGIEHERLITLCKNVSEGDRSAEEKLSAVLLPYLISKIVLKVGPQLASDIVQEVLILVIVKLRAGAVNNPAAIKQYALSIAEHHLISHYKQLQKWQQGDTVCEDIASEEISSLKIIEEQQTKALLLKAIATLPQMRDRMVLTLLLNAQDKHHACQQLSMQPDDFDRVVCRARARLVALMKNNG